MSTFNDLVFSSDSNDSGVLHSSCSDIQKGKPNHFVFLSKPNQKEIQNCLSKKIPIVLEANSLKESFSALKWHAVKVLYVNPIKKQPLIDVAWMNVARQTGKSVVFCWNDFRRMVSHQNVKAIERMRFWSRLLEKYKVPVGIASFAEKEESVSKEELDSLAGYFGIKKLEIVISEW
jgi:RNase P/RNase MRP subunit p30